MALELAGGREHGVPEDKDTGEDVTQRIIGRSPALREVLDTVRRVAPTQRRCSSRARAERARSW